MQKTQESSRYTWDELLVSIMLIFGIAIPVLYGSFFLNFIGRVSSLLAIAISIPIYFVIALSIYYLFRKRLFENWSNARFLLVFISLSALFRLAYTLLIDMDPVSDFKTMWDYSGQVVFHNVQYSASSIFNQRCFCYFIPLVYLFGKSSHVYALANILSHSICVILIYSLSLRWFGRLSARCAVLILLLVPETFFAMEIPTHDIPGALFLLLALWLTDTTSMMLKRSFWISFICSVLVGLSILLLEIQRNTGDAFLLTLFAYLLLIISRESKDIWISILTKNRKYFIKLAKWAFVVVFVPIIAYKFGYHVLEANELVMSLDKKQRMQDKFVFSHSDSWSRGSYAEAKRSYYDKYRKVFYELELHELNKLTIDKLLSDIYINSFEKILSYFERSKTLYRLGSQGYFYYDAKASYGVWLTNWNSTFAVIFQLAVFISIAILVWYRFDQYRMYPALIFLSIISLSLLFLSECQPRYVISIWYIGTLIIVAGINRFTAKNKIETRLACIKKQLGVKTVITSVSLLIGLITFYCFERGNHRRMLDFNTWTDFQASYNSNYNEYIKNIQTQIKAKSHFQLSLMHGAIVKSGDWVKATKKYRVSDGARRRFRVFVHHPNYEGDKNNEFEVRIVVNGQAKAIFHLEKQKIVRLIDIHDIAPIRDEIVIELSIHAKTDIDPSFKIEEILTHFEFAQLLKNE